MVRAYISRIWPVLCAMLCLAVISVPAAGDDAAVEGVGGSIKAMDEHPSVVMQSESVEATIRGETAHVHCTFVFTNDGPAAEVKMGFPERGWGQIDLEHPHGFTSFRSSVDGKAVPTKIEGLKADESSWRRWRTKAVPFEAGETRRVEVRYEQGLGGMSGGARFFKYEFHTGASWKGKIGHAKMVVRFVAMKGWSSQDGEVLDGTKIVREWHDFEPTWNDDFFVDCYPPPRVIVVLDGKRVNLPSDTAPLPQWGGGLRVPARWLADQIGATLTWHPEFRNATLKRGDAEIILTTRTPHPEATNKVRCQIAYGRLVAPAEKLIEALGGEVHRWPSVNKLVFNLPPLPAD